MKLFILLLVTLAVVNAGENLFFLLGESASDKAGELGKGCCMPTQWEGRVGAVHVTKKFLRHKVRASDSKIGIDFENKTVAVRSMFYCTIRKKIIETRTVVDFNAKKAYFIYKNWCKAFNVNEPLNPPCIPDSFRQFSPYFYGVENASLALSAYGFRNNSLAILTVVTEDSCVPVKAAFTLKKRFNNKMGSYQYFNITMGNQDKDLYTVPEFCQSNSTRYVALHHGSKPKDAQDEEEFHLDDKLTGQVKGDPLTQLIDIVNESVELTMATVGDEVPGSDGHGKQRYIHKHYQV